MKRKQKKIESPLLADPTRKSLVLERGGNRQKRINRQMDAVGDPHLADKAQVVAEGIVDAFLTVVDSLGAYYAEHPDHRAELVEKIAGVIERAFGGP